MYTSECHVSTPAEPKTDVADVPVDFRISKTTTSSSCCSPSSSIHFPFLYYFTIANTTSSPKLPLLSKIMTFHLGPRKATTKLAISLAARRRRPSSCPRSLSAFAGSNQLHLPALSNATPPISSNNHLGQRRWMSEESSSSSSSSSSAPSDRLHSTE